MALLFSNQAKNRRTGIGHLIIYSGQVRNSSSLTFGPSRLPSLACCLQPGKSFAQGLAPLLWLRLTSVLEETHPPASRFLRLNVHWTFTLRDRSVIQVRTSSFRWSPLHLLNRVCCPRALACCATLPTRPSLLCSSCSSVPAFAVPLPSDSRSLGTPLRLTNGLRQLAHKGLSPSRFIRYLYTGGCPCRAHTKAIRPWLPSGRHRRIARPLGVMNKTKSVYFE